MTKIYRPKDGIYRCVNGFAKPNLLLADGMIDMMLTGKLPGITNIPPA